jgi:hypothetical protein
VVFVGDIDVRDRHPPDDQGGDMTEYPYMFQKRIPSEGKRPETHYKPILEVAQW